MSNNDDKNTAKIRLRNLIQPTFVKKSYRYRGIPPRTKTSKAISKTNLIVITTALTIVVFTIKHGIRASNQLKSLNIKVLSTTKL
jgi:hypothetical protein